MKSIIFLFALAGIAAAKGDGPKCLDEMKKQCSWGRNEVQQCIDGHWVNVDFCQNPRFGVDNGFCTEAPEVACRRPEDPVETVWAPPPSVLGAEPTRSAIEGPDWR